MKTATTTTEQEARIAALRGTQGAIYRHKSFAIVGVIYPLGNRYAYALWMGAGAKPTTHYAAKDFAAAQAGLRHYWLGAETTFVLRTKQQAEKAARRAGLKASDHWTVGDVGYTSWGYDQTNVEFYQVVRLLPRSVVVRQVCANSSDHGQPGGGRTAPRRWEFVGPEQVCPLREDGAFNAGPCHGGDKPIFRHHVSKWTGSSVYTSSDR